MLAETRHTSAAALCTAIRAAAESAPEFRPDAPELSFPLGAYEIGNGGYVDNLPFGTGRTWHDWHGPLMPEPERPKPVRIGFAYSDPFGTRGRLTVEYLRPALLRLADQVHANRGAFDGKVKRAPNIKRAPQSAPHVAARAMWSDGDRAGALTLAQNHGAVYFGNPGAGVADAMPYMGAESLAYFGEGFTVARSICTGRFRALHTRSGLSVDSHAHPPGSGRDGFATYSAALDWLETQAQCEAWQSKVRIAAAPVADFSQADALALYLGSADSVPDVAAPTVAPAAGADPIAEYSARTGVTVRHVSAEEFDATAAACQSRADREDTARRTRAEILARFGVSSTAACPAALQPECARIEAACTAQVESERNPVPPGCVISGETADPSPTVSQAARPDTLTWQVLSAQPTAIYCTPVYRIGVHEWCTVVYSHSDFAACTDHLWRRVDQNRGAFKKSVQWSKYDSDDTHSGLPQSLCKRVFEPNREAIEIALAQTQAGNLPDWASATVRKAAADGIASRQRFVESLARHSASSSPPACGITDVDPPRAESKPIAWPALSDAAYRPAGPALRIPDADPRVRIPARFTPSYVLQA